MTEITTICRRLSAGEDLYESLLGLVSEHRLAAAAVVSVVGSLESACLRLAGASEAIEIPGPLEIISGTGTLCPDGLHVHVAVADAEGTTRGGQLTGSPGAAYGVAILIESATLTSLPHAERL